MLLRETVDHGALGDGAYERAALSSHRQHVQAQETEGLQRGEEGPVLVEDPQAVGVAVRCQRHVHAAGARGLDGGRQVRLDGLWLAHAGESGVHLAAQLGDGGIAAAYEARQVPGAGPVHAVDDDVQPRGPDGRQIHHALDVG